MINELHQLAKALSDAGVETQKWHKDYKLIPYIKKNKPCVCITCSRGKIVELSTVAENQGKNLRKYGSNNGMTYPCMNLAPLYRIDKEADKMLNEIKKHPESLDDSKLALIQSWCIEDNNNWADFLRKCNTSLQKVPAELSNMKLQYPPLEILMKETQAYGDNPEILHKQLEEYVWGMLRRKENVSLALYILFYCENPNKPKEYGGISVAFDSAELIQTGVRAVSERFVSGLNEALLQADSKDVSEENRATIDVATDRDAFGVPSPSTEKTVPSVKLAGGFDATLRTMFGDQYCQIRYGKADSASYPLSKPKQQELAAALIWLSGEERRDKTWVNLGKNEILFAYPYASPRPNISFTKWIKPQKTSGAGQKTFETQAKSFIHELREGKDPETDSAAKCIHVFILRKLDKARTKIVYTRQTDAYEIERCSEAWTIGCAENLPEFPFGKPPTPFPSEVADILNRFWKQDGTLIPGKLKPVPLYYGMELLLEPSVPADSDLRRLCSQALSLGGFLGNLSARKEYRHMLWEKVKGILALMGLLLYRKGIRKERYMENYPYLYGQLLKASDELHGLYCMVVRNGDIPPQLAGGALFQAATEAPIRTLTVLSQRMMPYYTWAKSYRLKNIQESGKESWRAGWLVSMCESIMTALQKQWTDTCRFTDEEKAQLFIGYLAAFPKKKTTETILNEEVQSNE